MGYIRAVCGVSVFITNRGVIRGNPVTTHLRGPFIPSVYALITEDSESQHSFQHTCPTINPFKMQQSFKAFKASTYLQNERVP